MPGKYRHRYNKRDVVGMTQVILTYVVSVIICLIITKHYFSEEQQVLLYGLAFIPGINTCIAAMAFFWGFASSMFFIVMKLGTLIQGLIG